MSRQCRQVLLGASLLVIIFIIVSFYSSGLRFGSQVEKTGSDTCCDESKTVTVAQTLGKCCTGVKQNFLTLKCDCESLLAHKLVIATAFSDNHFEEATDFIASVQTHMPNTSILVYDLGIGKDNRDTLSTYCQVTVRDFKVQKYPKHVKNLGTYAWKPLIINEIYQEMKDGVILYCDASCRLQSSLNSLLPRFSWFPIISGQSDSHLFISTTHDGMKKYLHLNKTRKEYTSIGNSLQANAIMFWLNSELGDRFLKYWVDCALHQECIAPQGAIVYPCNFAHMKEGVYACHRYDQAAYNAILTREFGFEFMKQLASNSADKYIKITRHPTKDFKLKLGKECRDHY